MTAPTQEAIDKDVEQLFTQGNEIIRVLRKIYLELAVIATIVILAAIVGGCSLIF
jgi:hypothetical protein